MKVSSVSDKIVFLALKNIKHGNIIIKNYNGEEIILGDKNSSLRANVKVNKPGFTLDIISKGSVGLAESYMNGNFETDNLTNLIEISARNIKTVHKFSGILDISFINYVKNFFINNTKKEAKKIFQNIMILGMNFFNMVR